MKSGLVYLRPSRLAYVRVTGPYAESAPRAWDRMLGWLDSNRLATSIERGYGMMRDDPGVVAPEQCRFDACVDLNPLFEERAVRELGAQILPGGTYVRTRLAGNARSLCSEVLGFYAKFNAPQGLRFDGRRPMVTIFLEDPRRYNAEDLRADVCIPVSAEAGRQEKHASQRAS